MSSNATPPNAEMSTVKRALHALQTTRARLEALERAQKEPIAIIGMGCRLPGGADSPEAFWALLHEGRDAVGKVPASRWDADRYYDPDYDAPGKMVTREGAFLAEIRESDPRFFGIAPREAASIDPQHHLLLEVCWETLEHAGLVPAELEGSRTGVFVGICNQDYSVLLMDRDPVEIDAYMTTGMAHSVAAGRLAFTFGFQGPCLAVDTACSSSLVAVHLACQSLRNRECDLAVAGGVNLILCPETGINFSKNRMLSRDGRCKTFSAEADGFGRGEGCGLILLKRLSDVVPGRERVLAVIRGSAVNQDGATSGLTVPNGPAQQAVMREALRNGGVEARQVGYLEAHGTGTALGDPIEINAVNAVYGEERPADRPLVLGSVKTNLGHLEAAAGISGLMKAVLALAHGEIPKHLHFDRPSPHIPWRELPLRVAGQAIAWPRGEEPRLAGVSAFGFSGTNVHVVLEEAPPAPASPPPTESSPERPVHILALSARSPEALAAQAGRYADVLVGVDPARLADVCYSAHSGRAVFEHRLMAVAADADTLRAKLARYAQGDGEAVACGLVRDAEPPRLAWLFTGQGCQYPGMGMALYRTQPVFRAALDACAAILDPLLGRSLIGLLSGPSADLDPTAHTQPALFALEYSLAQLWLSWGVQPDAVMGHSVGEYVAACVAGVFGLEDGLALIAERGRLMGALPRDGAMLAVFADAGRVARVIAALPEAARAFISIAAENGPTETVVSGEREAVKALAARLAEAGVLSRDLSVSHAFHSALMEPMLDDFERAARRIALSPPRLRLVSNLTGEAVAAEVADPAYWRRHVRQPVLFGRGIAALRQMGVRAFLEIGPHPVLSRMVRAESQAAELCLPSLRRDQAEWEVLADSLGRLHLGGIPVDWAGFDRPYARRRVDLPTYPFQRRRHWYTDRAVVGVRRATVPTPTSKLVALLDAGGVDELAGYLRAGADLTAEEQSLLPKLAGLLLRRHGAEAGPDGISSEDGAVPVAACQYRPVWREQARQSAALPAANTDQTWLVFSPDGESELARQFREAGWRCVQVVPGAAFQRVADDEWRIDAGREADYRRLLDTLAAETRVRGVVYAWPSDPPPENPDWAQIEAEPLRVVYLARALAHDPAPLWLLTRNATAVGDAVPVSPFPALAFGLGRSLFLEYPALKGGVVDAEPGEEAALVREFLAPDGEDAITLRSGRRHMARLEASPAEPAVPPVRFRPDGAYLITGGLGSLGLETAGFLAGQGAGLLVLMGRRGADQQARAVLDRIEEQGTRVVVERADSTDASAVRGVLERIAASGYPLRGVIHAAGALVPRAVAELDAECLRAVLAPKLRGAWILHRLTLALPLDFFVGYSSVSSVLGTARQAHYTAANGFLDGLAEYRRGLGLPGLAINWGPWREGGMIDADTARRIADSGFRPMPPQVGLAGLAWALGGGASRAVVVDADWPRLKSLYETRGRQPVLESVGLVASPPGAGSQDASLVERIQATPARDRFDTLVAHLQTLVGAILRFDPESPPDAKQGFFDVGMDSLTAVELKHRLESQFAQSLPPSLVFDYPNIEALAAYLLETLFPAATPAQATPAAGEAPPPPPVREDIRRLSDQEIAELIDGELASLTDED